MNNLMRELIISHNLNALRQALSENPALANEGIPYDESNTAKAVPLHRICDGVFSGKFSDEEAVEMAKLFLEYGADINAVSPPGNDSPLTAAASLHADQVAILLLEKGADIHHAGCHGGTALHWAAWCGRPLLVSRLIEAGSEINRRCVDFKSTPLFWAVHGLKSSDRTELQEYQACIKSLVEAGADKDIPNAGGQTIYDIAREENFELFTS